MTEGEGIPSAFSLDVMPHDFRCGAFDCKVASINNALRGDLLRAIGEGRTRAYYVQEEGKCLGFIALRAESFDLADSIDREKYIISARKVPGVLLELIAVDKDAKGRGLGRFLLFAALTLAREVSERVGARFLVLDSLPDAVDFYAAKRFKSTAYQPDSGTVFMMLDLLEVEE